MIKSKNYLNFFVITTRTFHKRLAILFILTIIVSLLDVFSIGSLWPLLNYVTQSEFNNNLNYNFLNYFKNEINNDNLLKIICGIILFLFLAKNIFIYIYAKFNTNLLSYLTIYHQEIILQNILKKKWDFFLRKNSAELIREFNTDIRELNANFIQPIFSIALSSLTLIFFLFFLFQINPTVVSYALIFCFMIFIFFVTFFKKKFIQLGEDRRKQSFLFLKIIKQIFDGIRELKIYNKEVLFINSFKRTLNRLANVSVSRNMILISSKLFIEVAAIIILIITLLVSDDARLILPTLGIFVAAAYRIVPNINILIKSVQNLDFGKSTINELSSYFAEQKEDVKHFQKDFQFKYQIEFKKVIFQYDSKNLIFDHANLVIKKNSIIGIYGNSGIGKSTFVDLLTGILKVNSGIILIDDKEISNLDEQSWLAKISYIQQNPFIFNHSIISNIALEIDTNKIDINKIKKVISLVNLNDFVSSLKNGYTEIIGEFGADISGGQSQRIGIARALYKDSDILIFDESFNSLDKYNRDEILDLIRKLKTNATIIIISHDNSSFVHCDEVYRIVNKNFERKI